MIPDELRDLPQWVGWRVEARKGKPTKVPVNPHTGKRASSTDSATWGTYRQALATLTDGVGFVFSSDDPYCGLDIDGCIGPNGALHPAVYAIVKRCNGYVEFSPSGFGLHIIVRGLIPRGRHTLKTEWHNELAIYSSGRFFTMSGDGRGEITEAQHALNYLVSYYFPEDDPKPPVARSQPLSRDDSVIVDRVLADPRMAALWRGDTSEHGEDHSAADLALLAHLAFYTGGDRMRMDSLFRRSGLYREKWERQDYRERTLEKALAS